MNILLAQLNPIVGDLTGNADKIIKIIESDGNKHDLIILPELIVTGYPPLDLVERPDFMKAVGHEMGRIAWATAGRKAHVAFGHLSGTTTVDGRKLYNAMSVYWEGDLMHWYAKHLLPTYNIFDESRHFKPGETNTPVTIAGVKTGFLICEDIWNDKDTKFPAYDVNPVKTLVGQGAKMIVALNASPSNIGKQEQREEMCREICRKNGIKLAYVNQVGANDDIVFDGNSFFMQANGDITAHAASFKEELLSCDTEATAPVSIIYPEPVETIFEHCVLGIADYTRKCGFKTAVVGSSGGIDSAVTIALASIALGPENVYAVTMPTGYSSPGSVSDSKALCNNFGIKLFNFPIRDLFANFHHQFLEDISLKGFGTEQNTIGLEWENVQPRLRGMTLMAFSNRYGSLVLSTGNKSELSVGYCTLYGDMCGGLAVISDVYKMEVFALARYINKRLGKEMIPTAIIDKEPSAELAPDQKDTDSLPPYPVLDAILRIYIEGNDMSVDDLQANVHTITRHVTTTQKNEDAYDLTKAIRRKVDNAEHKRRQAPPGIRCHARAFGAGRRLPIARK